MKEKFIEWIKDEQSEYVLDWIKNYINDSNAGVIVECVEDLSSYEVNTFLKSYSPGDLLYTFLCAEINFNFDYLLISDNDPFFEDLGFCELIDKVFDMMDDDLAFFDDAMDEFGVAFNEWLEENEE